MSKNILKTEKRGNVKKCIFGVKNRENANKHVDNYIHMFNNV
jgi:hypothetical protein